MKLFNFTIAFVFLIFMPKAFSCDQENYIFDNVGGVKKCFSFVDLKEVMPDPKEQKALVAKLESFTSKQILSKCTFIDAKMTRITSKGCADADGSGGVCSGKSNLSCSLEDKNLEGKKSEVKKFQMTLEMICKATQFTCGKFEDCIVSDGLELEFADLRSNFNDNILKGLKPTNYKGEVLNK